MSHKYANYFHIDRDFVVRWNSNNAVPFQDMLLEFLTEGLITTQNYNNSNAQRAIDIVSLFKRYAENQKNYVQELEELAEMRSAFGRGAKVVNVITGRRIQL
jgi:hypothetical protein